MNLRTLMIEELQSNAIAGDEEALKELGRRVLHLTIHDNHDHITCTYRWELEELQTALNMEIPLECPHCGGWLTDI